MVHRYSRGIPRLINTICENALITVYSRQAAQITPAMVPQVAADFSLPFPKRTAGKNYWGFGSNERRRGSPLENVFPRFNKEAGTRTL